MRLLLGANGQVGRALARTGEVVALTRLELDLADESAVQAALDRLRPTCVINGAAYTAVDRAESESAAAMAINAHAVGDLARACAERGVALVHFSTDYVFDGSQRRAYLESDPPGPLSVYGASKLLGEELLREQLERHWILRVAWVFSPDGGNFVKTILRLGQEREELRVVDDQHGCPTPAAVVAQTTLAMIDQVPCGTYHLACGPALSWHRFAEEILECGRLAGMPIRCQRVIAIPSAEYPTPARRPANSVLNDSKLRALLDLPKEWRPWLERCVDAFASVCPRHP
jgi:dTDP-4-dehydrorhamnose reductase